MYFVICKNLVNLSHFVKFTILQSLVESASRTEINEARDYEGFKDNRGQCECRPFLNVG